MRFLLISFLLFNGCAERKKSDLGTANTIIESNTTALSRQLVAREYIEHMDQLALENPDTLIARYDKGLDLILVDINESKNIINHFLPKENENYREYRSIYWDKISHNYYHTSIEKYTNKILYSQDSNFQQEPTIIEQYKEYIINDTPLLYIGSISPLERIYINTNDNTTYLKRLTLIDDSFYLTDDQTPKKNQNKHPVFPIVFILSSHDNKIDNPVPTTLYTNDNIYDRYPMDRGMLKIKNKNTSLEELFIDLAPYFIIKEVYPRIHEFNG